MLNTFPSGKSYPTSEDDRFYRAAIDLDMSLTVHVGMQLPDGPFFKYDKNPGEVAFGGDPIRVLTRFGGNGGLNAVQLLLFGVFDRIPKLKIYWAETQMGWLPYYYTQLDDVYKRSRHWMERYFGLSRWKRNRAATYGSTVTGDLSTTPSGCACAMRSASTGSCGATTSRIPRATGRIRAASSQTCSPPCRTMSGARFSAAMSPNSFICIRSGNVLSRISLNNLPLPLFFKEGFKNSEKSSPLKRGSKYCCLKISWPFESFVFSN